jgi:pyridoxamine 5'-phosphate oxidase
MTPAEMRKEYTQSRLDEADVDSDPVRQFLIWFQQAVNVDAVEATAMTLATATRDGVPSARIVLLKNADERGFAFFTNRDSRKGREIDDNPRAALVFYWPELERQVRIEGRVVQVSDEESDAYFRGRPRGSQLAAWASPQSQIVPNRAALESREQACSTEYANAEIPRPPRWGGYRVVPEAIEFWQGGANRLHDRLRYERLESGGWTIDRLAP